MKEFFNNTNWSNVITVIIAIIGWGISYYLINNQIRRSKQKELITSYLIEAYRNLEDGMGRDSNMTVEQKRKMEKAIADIQLFGTEQQRKLAKELTDECNKSSYMDDRKLLIILRNDLRKELGLEEAPKNYEDIYHWRLK